MQHSTAGGRWLGWTLATAAVFAIWSMPAGFPRAGDAATGEKSAPAGDGAGQEDRGDAATPADPQWFLEQAAASRGGLARLQQLKTVRRQGQLLVPSQGEPLTVPMSIMVQPPGGMVLLTGEGDEQVERTLRDGQVWERRGTGRAEPLGEVVARRWTDLVQMDEAFVLAAALAGELEIAGLEDAGPGQVEPGRPAAQGMAVILRTPQGSEYRLVFPRSGGLPLRVDYTTQDAQGGTRSASEVFIHWHDVEGLLFPGEVVLFQDGRPVSATRFDTLSVEWKAAD